MMRGLLVFLVVCAISVQGVAQPTLPDLAAHSERGHIVLSWNSQFDKLKTIRVRRSVDSVSGFTVIGELFNPKKGIQSFTDTVPLHGDSWYKLMVTFSSGLNWSSNMIHVYVKGQTEVRTDNGISGFMDKSAPVKVRVGEGRPGHLEDSAFRVITNSRTAPKLVRVADPQLKNYIDSATPPVKEKEVTLPPKQRVKLRFQGVSADTGAIPDLYISSKYVVVDSLSGNVLICLPDNARLQRYSIQFFDSRNKLIWAIPKLKDARLIMDKRNFQHKGVYSFILKKGQFEIERGNFILH